MGEEDTLVKKKAHRDRHSGRKAAKKKTKKDAQNVTEEQTDRQRNPKAFTFNSVVRAERKFRRKQDIETKRQHIPLVDRAPIEPPPILVAVVGPPKVGKTTLINNLIKLFTKSPLTDVKGPVTIVTGKKRRLTLIECNNDINSMIDLAKVADLVLLLCDASFGFEMEVFEFLNICQVHGMPKIMGVLTHLDMIKNNKTLKTTKKTLKHRFWTEVYPGAKLFYLSGIIHGEYLRNEITNLGRFISVMKFRPLTWRMTHSYLIGDRYEDLTNQEVIRKNPNCDRNVSLYGYVRGVPLKKDTSVHIAGLGDLKIHDISYLPDPCPLPDQIKKRALVEKEKLIYAPFSGIGGIVYDKDAVYVELGGSHSHNRRDGEDESDNIVVNLIDSQQPLDMKLKHSELQIFSGGEKLTAQDFEENVDISEPDNRHLYERETVKNDDVNDLYTELNELRKQNFSNITEEKIEDSERVRRKVIFKVSDEEFVNSIQDESEMSDEECLEEINGINTKNTQEYVDLKENKDKDIYSKIANVISTLEKKPSEEKVAVESNSSDDSDLDLSYLTKESQKNKTDLHEVDDSDSSEIEDTLEKISLSEEKDENMSLKWKENLAKKAEEAFLDRINSTQNLMKLVYGIFSTTEETKTSEEQVDDDEEENIGGLFRKVSQDQQKLKLDKDSMNLIESSLILPWNVSTRDWLQPENKALIINCFVTGKWKDSKNASELLKLDDAEDLSDANSEVFGDFEDLETGVKHEAQSDIQGKKRKKDESEKDEQADREALIQKKLKLKEKFNEEYDNSEKTSYYDGLKMAAEKQAELNKTVFENLPDDVRVQIEGFRPGMYVRIEFVDVPAEFINNFDPTYPIIIGALNMGEENVGYVNVKIKKHRWYNKILKTGDPLIISLGWRRFQTKPLYSKLEDDLKFRYLKYTPQHLSCNAHFWGPITPQGSGFLALQTVSSRSEVLKKQNFRIAATGSIQELDKSTQIMKKLKLIGYPLKIYKKTAFIKGMFNSALEVARFEGARLKTVSGIRGQIKKAVNKPEGCFRATFEDKIQLSDIVFCRTWYKVDVPQYYNPLITLLLPPEEKNLWEGVRTLGEIKRDKNIRNPANIDSSYTPIVREQKPFKPLVIPKKLQEALPYRDKPKHGVKFSEKNKSIDRVAVIREPHEQKVSTMMKMIKTSYLQRQEKIKAETNLRLEKHRQMIAAQEAGRDKKIKQKKKEMFRNKSKAQSRPAKKK